MKTEILICKTCGCKTTDSGHLCDPKKVSKKIKFYICAKCGLITTEKYLLCRPKLLKLK
ncbi:MAG: hypothetical protein KKC75_01875 [Nanoarchaeota archaeon]|nr:hypothetical protein [Nanoarchaeota archaeon]MBU1005716.1 hypothetical protein [Nanoarchaeota archaeon]MBU1945599.1 hypothetical protein [Nanoarchaeota archaeon]